jgi:hypothetical protein
MIILNVDLQEEDPTKIIKGDEEDDMEDPLFDDGEDDDDDRFAEVDPSDER